MSDREMTAGEQKAFLLSTLDTSLRRALELTFAGTFDNERNVWVSCGYPSSVTDEEMELRYERMGVATQIVDAYPIKCWSKSPDVYETEQQDETEFEKRWNALSEKEDLRLWNAMKDVDRLAGRGKYAVLLIGFDDGRPLDSPATGAKDVLYLLPFHPQRVNIAEKERERTNPRYGRPTKYNLTKNLEDDKDVVLVHWTRVVHVADCTDDVDWIGIHRLHRVFNYLLDLEKVAAGSSEMFWKGGYPGMGLMLDKDMNPSQTELDKMDASVRDFFHGLTRSLRLRGVTPHQFQPNISDPTAQFNLLMSLISLTVRIPVKVLMGSEMSKMAGDQDTDAWHTNVEDRRSAFCQPNILLPFIRRCQAAGALPPLDKVKIEWPTLKVRSDKEDADIARVRTDALARYASTPGMEIVMPVYYYFTEVLKLSDRQAREIISEAAKPYGGEEGLRKALTEVKKESTQGGEGSGGLGVGADRQKQVSEKPRAADATRRDSGVRS